MYISVLEQCPVLPFHFAFTYQCRDRCHRRFEHLEQQTCLTSHLFTTQSK